MRPLTIQFSALNLQWKLRLTHSRRLAFRRTDKHTPQVKKTRLSGVSRAGSTLLLLATSDGAQSRQAKTQKRRTTGFRDVPNVGGHVLPEGFDTKEQSVGSAGSQMEADGDTAENESETAIGSESEHLKTMTYEIGIPRVERFPTEYPAPQRRRPSRSLRVQPPAGRVSTAVH